MAYFMHDAGPYVRKWFDICKLLAWLKYEGIILIHFEIIAFL